MISEGFRRVQYHGPIEFMRSLDLNCKRAQKGKPCCNTCAAEFLKWLTSQFECRDLIISICPWYFSRRNPSEFIKNIEVSWELHETEHSRSTAEAAHEHSMSTAEAQHEHSNNTTRSQQEHSRSTAEAQQQHTITTAAAQPKHSRRSPKPHY